MALLDRLERRFGRFALPHLTESVIACQALTFLLLQLQPDFPARLLLIPKLVLQGEVWRLATFVCQPPSDNFVWAFIGWWFFFFVGTVLESTWGAFRYNVYLLTGYLGTVLASFFYPTAPAQLIYLQLSVFFAFAFLYPDFKILVFFILPVKVKWLALVQWVGYGLLLLDGDWQTRLCVAVAMANFWLFFWRDIVVRVRAGRRRVAHQVTQIKAAQTPRHACVICGADSIRYPKKGFRYCSKCAGSPCYCSDHIHDHAHIVEPPEPSE